jgi:dienelactone hydrolase
MSGQRPTDVGTSPTVPAGAPFGRWPSPWSAAMVAAGKVSRSGLLTDGDALYWSESRPDEGGRQVVVRVRGRRPPEVVSPHGVSVRTRVHEYGGAAAWVEDGTLFYVDQADQHWHRSDVDRGSAPVALTDGTGFDIRPTDDLPPEVGTARYGDGRLLGSGAWMVSVEERFVDSRVGHRLVAVSTDGAGPVVPLTDRGDFVAAPRPSPNGAWLAWVTWDHPFMPWDSSELWVARIVETDQRVRLLGARRIGGGDGVSVGQPRWCHDGSLLFVDDRSGWWLPYRLAPDRIDRASASGSGSESEGAEPLVDIEAEFHAPDWVLGQSTMAELPDGSIVCRMRQDGQDVVVRLVPPEDSPDHRWTIETVDQPCVSISGLVAGPAGPGAPTTLDHCVYVLGSTPTEAHGVFEVWTGVGSTSRRVSAAPHPSTALADVAVAEPFTASTSVGPIPGLFFAPTNGRIDRVTGSRPPLVVFCHGGPTSAADGGFDPVVQFFTSRGLAVAAVNYRGSSGYGRSYRRLLDGLWGEADVDDCLGYAEALERAGLVDGSRMAIRGTSAGGLTALGALIRGRRFVGAASWYGVTDLEALAADTHDFESRYVDSLIGPWPEDAETYRRRSPIHHADRVSGAVLLLQGADDPVVPADQSDRFAAMLADHDVACRLIVFEGESHGFRSASTIEASLEAELGFYRSVFDVPVVGHPSDPTG